MRIDTEEDVILIDNVINIETHKAIQKDMHDMTLCGVQLPNHKEIREYTYDMRETVQDILQRSN